MLELSMLRQPGALSPAENDPLSFLLTCDVVCLLTRDNNGENMGELGCCLNVLIAAAGSSHSNGSNWDDVEWFDWWIHREPWADEAPWQCMLYHVMLSMLIKTPLLSIRLLKLLILGVFFLQPTERGTVALVEPKADFCWLSSPSIVKCWR